VVEGIDVSLPLLQEGKGESMNECHLFGEAALALPQKVYFGGKEFRV